MTRLYFGTTPENRYSMPDPDDPETQEALCCARYAPAHVTNTDPARIVALASAYQHFATHPAGTESVIKQLRELRRAVAEKRAAGGRRR